MREFVRKHGGVLYIALMTVIMVVLLVSSNELELIFDALGTMDVRWVCAAAGCIGGYLFCRMACIRYYLGRRGYRVSWRECMGVTGGGQFYSAITPSASGGQPMQVLQLRQCGVPAGVGTACISVKFLGFQISFLTAGALLAIPHWQMVNEQLFGMRWLTVLGFVVNALLIAAVLLATLKRSLLDRVCGWFIKIGAKLRLVRNPQKVMQRVEDAVGEYCEALKSLLRSPMDTLVILGLSLLQVLLYMSVTVCMYHAFGLSGTSVIELLTIQLLLFIAAAFIPLPGASGVQESGFCLFFHGIFPQTELMAAMICWRFFSYYLLMIAGLVMMALGRAGKKKIEKVEKWY